MTLGCRSYCISKRIFSIRCERQVSYRHSLVVSGNRASCRSLRGNQYPQILDRRLWSDSVITHTNIILFSWSKPRPFTVHLVKLDHPLLRFYRVNAPIYVYLAFVGCFITITRAKLSQKFITTTAFNTGKPFNPNEHDVSEERTWLQVLYVFTWFCWCLSSAQL